MSQFWHMLLSPFVQIQLQQCEHVSTAAAVPHLQVWCIAHFDAPVLAIVHLTCCVSIQAVSKW